MSLLTSKGISSIYSIHLRMQLYLVNDKIMNKICTKANDLLHVRSQTYVVKFVFLSTHH